MKVYWAFDVSRAVHPKVILQQCPNPNGMLVNNKTTSSEACVLYDESIPLPQEFRLLTNDTNINQEFMETLYSFNEGLLGVNTWNDYWEWAWQSLPKPYMHVPYSWAIGEFVFEKNYECKDEFFYGRFITKSVFYSLANYTSTNSLPLENKDDLIFYCGLQCSPQAILGLSKFPELFNLSISGTNKWWSATVYVKFNSIYSVTMTKYGNMTTNPPLPSNCLYFL